jgi:hypothetical protein
LETLLELAEFGCITEVQEFLSKLKALDEQFVPFISKVGEFIKKYQFEELVEFINNYRD